jgi:hypothetical protein
MGEYLQGDLSLGQRALFDAHLDGCETCAEDLRALRSTVQLLRELPTPEVPPHLVDRVIARIEDGDGRSRWWDGLVDFWDAIDPARYLPPLAAAALTSAAVIVGVRDLGLEIPGMRPPPGAPELASEAPAPERYGPPRPQSPPLRTERPFVILERRAASTADTAGSEAPELVFRGLVGASAVPGPEADVVADEETADVLSDPHRFLQEYRRVQAEAQQAWLERMAARARHQAEVEELMRRLREDAGPEGRQLADRFEAVAYPAGR